MKREQSENELTTSLATMQIFVSIFLESIFYSYNKVQADLFVSLKVIEQNQKQMCNLIDTVPDKVLICSSNLKPNETAKCYHTNKRMKNVFSDEHMTSPR